MTLPLTLASSAVATPVAVQVASSNSAVLVAFGAGSALLLIALLVVKELLTAYAQEEGVRGTLREDALSRLATAANLAVIPLAAVFALAVVAKVLEYL